MKMIKSLLGDGLVGRFPGRGLISTKAALVLVLLVITAITCIKPLYPTQMSLQHSGTTLLIILLLYDTIRDRMPMYAFVGVALFALLHIVGARWIYSYVPYREWFVSLGVPVDYWGVPAGYNGALEEFFDYYQTVLRNHYDRLIHFSFGLLMFPFLLHEARKWVERKPLIAVLVAWLLIQAGSLIYEIFEWQLSVWSKEGDAYNGQQGDIWDAQKDMMLAMIGSTIMAVFYAISDKCKKREMFASVYAAVLLLCGLAAWVWTGGLRCSSEECAKILVKRAVRVHNEEARVKNHAVLFYKLAHNLGKDEAEIKFEKEFEELRKHLPSGKSKDENDFEEKYLKDEIKAKEAERARR